MNLLDGVVLVLAALAAVGGYRIGALTRVLSWAGWVLALALFARIGPDLSASIAGDDPVAELLLLGIVLVVGGSIGQAVGALAGARLRGHLGTSARGVDRMAGVGVSLAAVLALAWVILPLLADSRGEAARLARGSVVADVVESITPPPPSSLRSLDRLVGGAVFPDVLGPLDRAPSVGEPPTNSALSEPVLALAARSTVRIESRGCGGLQDGTGFVVEPEVVLTNAHVVAGTEGVTVDGAFEGIRDAEVVAFDPDRDIALLRVPGLGAAALPLADATVGDIGSVLGHPGGGPLEVSPFQVAERIDALGRDLYDRHDTRRDVVVLASDLAPGDSGGPLVAPSGSVLGVAFAIAPDDAGTAYALSTDEIRAALDEPRRAGGRAGPCVS